MPNEFIEYVKTQMDLSAREIKAIEKNFVVKSYPKQTVLLSKGQVPSCSFVVMSGLVRLYYLVNGDEKTTHFFAEGSAIPAYYNAKQKKPSKFFLECVEDCKLAVLSVENEQRLFKESPQSEEVCRVYLEEQVGDQMEALANFLMLTPEQRYLQLQESNPSLINRVPQYVLASYLGVKPESLSRIRKRLMDKQI